MIPRAALLASLCAHLFSSLHFPTLPGNPQVHRRALLRALSSPKMPSAEILNTSPQPGGARAPDTSPNSSCSSARFAVSQRGSCGRLKGSSDARRNAAASSALVQKKKIHKKTLFFFSLNYHHCFSHCHIDLWLMSWKLLLSQR